VSRQIECDDGIIVTGATDDELVSAMEEHLRSAHPELAGRLSRFEILAMATEPAEESAQGDQVTPAIEGG
jgi:hypothetical protein